MYRRSKSQAVEYAIEISNAAKRKTPSGTKRKREDMERGTYGMSAPAWQRPRSDQPWHRSSENTAHIDATHTVMSGGSYEIPDDKMHTFLEMMSHDVVNAVIPMHPNPSTRMDAWNEIGRRDDMPVFADLDLLYQRPINELDLRVLTVIVNTMMQVVFEVCRLDAVLIESNGLCVCTTSPEVKKLACTEALLAEEILAPCSETSSIRSDFQTTSDGFGGIGSVPRAHGIPSTTLSYSSHTDSTTTQGNTYEASLHSSSTLQYDPSWSNSSTSLCDGAVSNSVDGSGQLGNSNARRGSKLQVKPQSRSNNSAQSNAAIKKEAERQLQYRSSAAVYAYDAALSSSTLAANEIAPGRHKYFYKLGLHFYMPLLHVTALQMRSIRASWIVALSSLFCTYPCLKDSTSLDVFGQCDTGLDSLKRSHNQSLNNEARATRVFEQFIDHAVYGGAHSDPHLRPIWSPKYMRRCSDCEQDEHFHKRTPDLPCRGSFTPGHDLLLWVDGNRSIPSRGKNLKRADPSLLGYTSVELRNAAESLTVPTDQALNNNKSGIDFRLPLSLLSFKDRQMMGRAIDIFETNLLQLRTAAKEFERKMGDVTPIHPLAHAPCPPIQYLHSLDLLKDGAVRTLHPGMQHLVALYFLSLLCLRNLAGQPIFKQRHLPLLQKLPHCDTLSKTASLPKGAPPNTPARIYEPYTSIKPSRWYVVDNELTMFRIARELRMARLQWCGLGIKSIRRSQAVVDVRVTGSGSQWCVNVCRNHTTSEVRFAIINLPSDQMQFIQYCTSSKIRDGDSSCWKWNGKAWLVVDAVLKKELFPHAVLVRTTPLQPVPMPLFDVQFGDMVGAGRLHFDPTANDVLPSGGASKTSETRLEIVVDNDMAIGGDTDVDLFAASQYYHRTPSPSFPPL